MPWVSVMWAASNEPPPAHRMVRVGALSCTSTSMAGTTASGCSASRIWGGNSDSVMRVAAVGARELTWMWYLAPSMASVCIRPTWASLAAP